MKILVNSCLLVLAMLAVHPMAAQINIQEFTFAKLVHKKTSEPSYVAPKLNRVDKIPNFYRLHMQLPNQYSGFAIELTTSDLPLKRNYFLFKRFGNVYYHRLNEGGYSYCILTDFSSKKSVVQFLDKVILARAPEAKLVQYKKGIRKN